MATSYFESLCTQELSKLRPNATFLAIHNYTNEFQELATFSVCFHINYLAAVKKSKSIVEAFKPSFKHCRALPFTINDLVRAREELLSSYADSLTGYNPLYTCHGVYSSVVDAAGNKIPGIKLHKNQDLLHMEGFKVHKLIHKRGTYPSVNSSPLTLAKDFLRQLTPLNRWVQFKLSPGKFEKFTVEQLTVTYNDVIRQSFPPEC